MLPSSKRLKMFVENVASLFPIILSESANNEFQSKYDESSLMLKYMKSAESRSELVIDVQPEVGLE